MTKREIAKRICLTGVFGDYHVMTGGFANLDYKLPLDDALTGHALVRCLREQATRNPKLFPEETK